MSRNVPQPPPGPAAPPPSGLLLASFLARAGVAARRTCTQFITEGQVTVNGERVVAPWTRVDPGHDVVTCAGETVRLEPLVYVLLDKPGGYTCTASDPHAARRALDLVQPAFAVRLFTVGRLDRDTEGLLLLTNDGALANRLLHPRWELPRVYHAEVTGMPDDAALRRLEAGIVDAGETLHARQAQRLRAGPRGATLEITVTEGKKREVRRLCTAIGCPVRHLRRIAFGPLRLGRAQPGSYRELTAAELAALRAAVGLSAT